jgi:hypothetical protein
VLSKFLDINIIIIGRNSKLNNNNMLVEGVQVFLSKNHSDNYALIIYDRRDNLDIFYPMIKFIPHDGLSKDNKNKKDKLMYLYNLKDIPDKIKTDILKTKGSFWNIQQKIYRDRMGILEDE